jgi:hypothetical protein
MFFFNVENYKSNTKTKPRTRRRPKQRPRLRQKRPGSLSCLALLAVPSLVDHHEGQRMRRCGYRSVLTVSVSFLSVLSPWNGGTGGEVSIWLCYLFLGLSFPRIALSWLALVVAL